jgi:transposase
MGAMTPEALFTAALQLEAGWKVVECRFEGEPKRLVLKLDFESGKKFECAQCGKLCPTHDTSTKQWRHLNFFQYECLLEARVARSNCSEHGVQSIAVPWAREGSGFTLLFEALVMLLCREMPMAAVADGLGEHDTRLWRVAAHYVEKAHANASWAQVRRISVDETSARRGHRYVTNVLDAHTHQLLLMVEGRSAEALESFAKELVAHGGKVEQIELISMDMSPAYQSGAQRFFPKAEIVFDHFHLMQMAGEALDKVRKQLTDEGAALKGSLWAIRGNEWTRSEEQCQQRSVLCNRYPKLGRAIGLRDMLQDILKTEDETSLRWWCKRAKLSRLEPFRDLAISIKKHWSGVVAFLKTRLTNGVIEAVNGLLQLAKRLARGFRSLRYFRIMAYLKASGLHLNLPALRTHSP